jgi:hypothetical protein
MSRKGRPKRMYTERKLRDFAGRIAKNILTDIDGRFGITPENTDAYLNLMEIYMQMVLQEFDIDLYEEE